jgi:adenosylhomocysteine nucleosidase
MRRLGIVTGLKSEALCITNTPVAENADTRVVAAVSARALVEARALAAQGCTALVSFGIAGGLDPRLKVGALILANEVIAPDGTRYQTDARARRALHQSLEKDLQISHAPILGSTKVIFSPRRKINLHVDSGAAAVDMESHAVAQAAAEAGIPFLVVRVISDNAYSRVPRSVIGAMAPDGGRRIWRVMLNLLIRPFDLPGLLRLQRGSAVAHKRLRSIATSGGAFLGFG